MLMLSLLGMLKAIEGLHETNSLGSLDLFFLVSFLPDTADPSEMANRCFSLTLKVLSNA